MGTGIIDKDGKIVVEPIYYDIYWDEKSGTYVACDMDKKDYLLDSYGKKVDVKPNFTFCRKFANGFAVAKIKNKYGAIDPSGKWVIEPKFDYIGNFSADGFAVVRLNGKCGLIDKNGKFRIEPKFDDMHTHCYDDGSDKYKEFKHRPKDMLVVKVGKKFGMVDLDGNFIAEPIYDTIKYPEDCNFAAIGRGKFDDIITKNGVLNKTKITVVKHIDDGVFLIYAKKKRGLADAKNGDIIEPRFDGIETFDWIDTDDDFLISEVRQKDQFGLVNRAKIIYEPKFSDIPFFSTTHSRVILTDMLFRIGRKLIPEALFSIGDMDGNLILDSLFGKVEYERSYDDNRLYFIVTINGKTGVMDENCKFIIKPKFEKIDWLDDEQFFIVTMNGKEGVVGKNGKFVIRPKFDYIRPLDNNTFMAGINDGEDCKIGIIDRKGKFLIEPKYFWFGPFWKSTDILVACVENGKTPKYQLITRDGNLIGEEKFDEIETRVVGSNEFLLVQNGKKYGAIDKNGKLVVPLKFKYNDIAIYEDNFIVTKGKKGILDSDGNKLLKNVQICGFDSPCRAFINDITVFRGENRLCGLMRKDGTVILEPISFYHELFRVEMLPDGGFKFNSSGEDNPLEFDKDGMPVDGVFEIRHRICGCVKDGEITIWRDVFRRYEFSEYGLAVFETE